MAPAVREHSGAWPPPSKEVVTMDEARAAAIDARVSRLENEIGDLSGEAERLLRPYREPTKRLRGRSLEHFGCASCGEAGRACAVVLGEVAICIACVTAAIGEACRDHSDIPAFLPSYDHLGR